MARFWIVWYLTTLSISLWNLRNKLVNGSSLPLWLLITLSVVLFIGLIVSIVDVVLTYKNKEEIE